MREGSGMSGSLEGSGFPSSVVVVGLSGSSGRPKRFLLARSCLASSSSRRIRDSSARRRRFSSRAALRAASSSSSLRFLRDLASRSRWMAACSSR